MNKARARSLRHQLLRHILGPLLVVLFVGSVITFAIARYIGNSVHDEWLLDSAMTLTQQVKVGNGRAVLELPRSAVEMFRWDSVDLIYEEVRSGTHGIISTNATFPPPPAGLVPDKPLYYDATIQGRRVRVVALAFARSAAVPETIQVQVAETVNKREAIAKRIILFLAPVQMAIQILAGIFIWFAVTRNLRQVDDIAARLVGYEPDKLHPISDAERAPSEIRPLVIAINGLIHKLGESQSSQRRFIANAAHQMRTPLAALQVQTQRALREYDPLKQSDALKDVLNAVTRLRHVVQQLLTLARSEPDTETMARSAQLDLAALAREEVERWTDHAVERGIDLGYEGPDRPVMINGEASLIRELVGNLLDNAIRYNVCAGKVTLAVEEAPTRLSVEDDGPGIPEQERQRVFERFYRAGDGREEGCGLGLSIAKEIAARHEAAITLSDVAVGPGTRAEIIFKP